MASTNKIQFHADPFDWPQQPEFDLTSFAIVVIDMQNDYCSPDCYMDKAGYDIDRLRKPIRPLQNVLNEARRHGIEIVYTRHSENFDPADIKDGGTSAYKSFGWEIVPELRPLESERVFDKTTVSAFLSGDLHKYLQDKQINNLIFCGNTIDVCVHSSLRTANDFGYKCLLLEDCCGAVSEDLHRWSVESVRVENGVFGAVTDSLTFVNDLKKL